MKDDLDTNELIEKLSLVDKVDRISSLPWEVLDNILGRLPMKVVVKMSILSQKWKNNWRNVSSVMLCDFRNTSAVYHVLLSHCGILEKFTLSMSRATVKTEDLTSWLNFLRRHHIKELTLQLSSVTSLSGITGFSKLVSLTLKNFTTEAVVLQSVIDGCPLLEKLKLLSIGISECLHINAHMLTSLHIQGTLKDVCIKCSPNLTDVHLNLNFPTGSRENLRGQGSSVYLVKFLDHLSEFKKLTLCGFILKIWYTGEMDAIVCNSLSVLALDDVRVDDASQTSAVCYLLKSASNLKEFSINLRWHNSCGRIGVPEVNPKDFNFCFGQLKCAKIDMGSYGKHEFGVALIRSILVSSRVLKEMTVKQTHCDTCDESFKRELLSIPRASMGLVFKYFCNKCSLTRHS